MFIPITTATDERQADGKFVTPPTTPFLFDQRNRAFIDGDTDELHPPLATIPRYAPFLLAFFVIFLGMLTLPAVSMFVRIALTSLAGAPIRAQIIDEHADLNSSRTVYTLVYTFTVDDQRYVVSQPVGSDYFVSLSGFGTLLVNYWPPDPHLAIIKGDFLDDDMFFVSLIQLFCPGSLLVLALFSFPRSYFRARRQRLFRQKLVRNGQVLYGQVVSSEGLRAPKSTYTLRLDYSFTTPDGRLIAGEEKRSVRELRDEPLPASGTSIAVLYADDQHFAIL